MMKTLRIFYLLVGAIVTWSNFASCQEAPKALKYILFSGIYEETYDMTNLYTMLVSDAFNQTSGTVFYFYGLSQDRFTPEVVKMIDAYLFTNNYNFVLITVPDALYKFVNEEIIGSNVAINLIELLESGLGLSTLEFVGFNLGANIAGYVARYVYFYSTGRFRIPRIVGINPVTYSKNALGPSDARFVLTIHTDNEYTNTSTIGDVAFLVNGGVSQPMCMFPNGDNNVSCSVIAGQLFWTDAVYSMSATVFPARKCDSFSKFIARNCNFSEPVGYMNPQAAKTLRGVYYLTTNKRQPFSKPLLQVQASRKRPFVVKKKSVEVVFEDDDR